MSREKAREYFYESVYNSYKKRAQRRNLKFDLYKNEFAILITKNCYYCGMKPCNLFKGTKYKFENFSYNGIDRRDNNEGYIIENSVSCCKFCNRAKYTSELKDFEEWINQIIKFRTSV